MTVTTIHNTEFSIEDLELTINTLSICISAASSDGRYPDREPANQLSLLADKFKAACAEAVQKSKETTARRARQLGPTTSHK